MTLREELARALATYDDDGTDVNWSAWLPEADAILPIIETHTAQLQRDLEAAREGLRTILMPSQCRDLKWAGMTIGDIARAILEGNGL